MGGSSNAKFQKNQFLALASIPTEQLTQFTNLRKFVVRE